MSSAYYGLIEIVLTAGGMIGFCVWQLRSLKRDRAVTNERLRRDADARSAAPADAPGHAEG